MSTHTTTTEANNQTLDLIAGEIQLKVRQTNDTKTINEIKEIKRAFRTKYTKKIAKLREMYKVYYFCDNYNIDEPIDAIYEACETLKKALNKIKKNPNYETIEGYRRLLINTNELFISQHLKFKSFTNPLSPYKFDIYQQLLLPTCIPIGSKCFMESVNEILDNRILYDYARSAEQRLMHVMNTKRNNLKRKLKGHIETLLNIPDAMRNKINDEHEQKIIKPLNDNFNLIIIIFIKFNYFLS